MSIELEHQQDYELFCQQKLPDPYPLFAELRQKEPIHWCEPLNTWLGFRYDDTLAAVKDPRFLSGRAGVYERVLQGPHAEKATALVDHLSLWMQSVNPPRHTRLRRLAGIAFTPRMIKNMVPRIREIVQQRLDVVRESGRCDLVETFCYWVPATVMCDMLGLPHNDHEAFRRWVGDLIPFSSGAGPALDDGIERAYAALQGLIEYFRQILQERRIHPRDDLISALVQAEEVGDRFTDEELFALCVFLFVAGHETTSSLLSSGTYLLLTHPELRLQLDPDDAAGMEMMIEEFLRYESPVTRAPRMVQEQLTLRGQVIDAGAAVTFLLGAANRDPDVFAEPERFDMQRQPNRHLAFGFGRHFCIGAELARVEARIAFPMILRQLPHLQWAGEEDQWHAAFGIRSLESLPVVTQ